MDTNVQMCSAKFSHAAHAAVLALVRKPAHSTGLPSSARLAPSDSSALLQPSSSIENNRLQLRHPHPCSGQAVFCAGAAKAAATVSGRRTAGVAAAWPDIQTEKIKMDRSMKAWNGHPVPPHYNPLPFSLSRQAAGRCRGSSQGVEAAEQVLFQQLVQLINLFHGA